MPQHVAATWYRIINGTLATAMSIRRTMSSMPRVRDGSNRNARPAARRSQESHHQQHRQNGKQFDDSYFLASRVRLLAQRNELDSAVDLVKRSPRQSATIVVWNVLINEHLSRNKIKQAYELWMDLKRRGLRPTGRSFATFLGGVARASAKQHGRPPASTVSRVKTVYAQWLQHVARDANAVQDASANVNTSRWRLALERDQTHQEDDKLTSLPTNHYLAFLSNVGDVESMLQTYSDMPSSGTLAPNSATRSVMLSGLRQHMALRPELFKVAHELWQQIEVRPDELDVRTASIMITLCREAKRPDDQRLGPEAALLNI
ncbi:hypothetical protein OIO90_002638 [Microbotryomycetes sp. JL221]|nr:hypothetical protein OIO90_002638 [Microbotryomycetes sp. JL221]